MSRRPLTPAELARLPPADRERYRTLYAAQYGGLSFTDFVHQSAPELGRTVPRHLRQLYRVIEESRHRPIRVKLSQPPGTGKTTTFSMAAAWKMLRDPSCLNFYVPGGDGLAVTFSYKTRKVARAVGVPLANDRANVHHWSTVFDGGLKAVSLFGDLVGRRCNGGLIFCDDMLRGREDAESKLKRDKIWDAFRDDLMSRMVPGSNAGVIVCNTRWHEDDIHGRLAKDPLGEEWEEIVIPAVVNERGEPTDQITDECVPVWPEGGYDLDWARKALARGAYGFWSLYQQQPRSPTGRMFAEPARGPMLDLTADDGWRLVFAVDPAATAKLTSDYWAGGILAMRGAGDATQARPIARFRLQARIDEVMRVIRQVRQKYPLPVWIEGIGTFALVPDAVKMADRTLPLKLVPSSLCKGDKKTRATGLSVCWNDPNGRFVVPYGKDGCYDDETWDDYIAEFRDFSGLDDPHDDQVDWTAHAFNIGYREAEGIDLTLPTTLPVGGPD